MNRKTIAFNLIVLIGTLSSFLANTTNVQAGYDEREKQMNIILESAVEFRWDRNKNTSKPHDSLGTKVSANTVLTHNHFSDLAGTYILDPSNPKRPHGVSKTTTTGVFGRFTQNGTQTRLVHSAVEYAGVVAPIASQRTIMNLRPGCSVDVVYWDDARNELAVAAFQIKEVRNGTLIVFDDPANIINGGDSGGGVFYNGELVGNTWRYIERFDGQGSRVSKVVQVQIIPTGLTQALRNW